MNISTPRFLIARDISPCLGSIDKNNLKKEFYSLYSCYSEYMNRYPALDTSQKEESISIQKVNK